MAIGVWLSMVECLVRDQEAAGSNPVTPMRKPANSLRFGGFSFFAFSGLTTGRTIDRAGVGETVFLVCSGLDFAPERTSRTGSGGCLPYLIISSVHFVLCPVV